MCLEVRQPVRHRSLTRLFFCRGSVLRLSLDQRRLLQSSKKRVFTIRVNQRVNIMPMRSERFVPYARYFRVTTLFSVEKFEVCGLSSQAATDHTP